MLETPSGKVCTPDKPSTSRLLHSTLLWLYTDWLHRSAAHWHRQATSSYAPGPICSSRLHCLLLSRGVSCAQRASLGFIRIATCSSYAPVPMRAIFRIAICSSYAPVPMRAIFCIAACSSYAPVPRTASRCNCLATSHAPRVQS